MNPHLLKLTLCDVFPELTQQADLYFQHKYGQLDDDLLVLWFECLAAVLNQAMIKEVDYSEYRKFFNMIENVLKQGESSLVAYLDANLIENLFWNVPKEKACNYWQYLPSLIKSYYLRFFNKAPC